jgi:hypothetical protein
MDHDVRVTKMPRSTGSSQFDGEQSGSAVGDLDARNLVHDRDEQLEAPEKASSLKRRGEGSAAEEILRWLARSLALLALLSSFTLLCMSATLLLTSLPNHIGRAAFRGWVLVKSLPLSALPLLLAGSSYIVLQAILRPPPLALVQRMMLGVAFLLWGVVEVMPVSDLATALGNVVIVLYVVDLGLVIWTELQKNQPRLVR